MLDRRSVLRMGGLALAGSAMPSRAADVLLSYGGKPQNLATPVEFFDRQVTPTSVFFVRSHFGPPLLDPGRRVRIGGLVDRPLALSVKDLAQFPEVTVTAVAQCAGNGRALHAPRVPGIQWVHGAMGQATWTGVRLADVLAAAGVQAGAAWVQLRGADLPPTPQVPPYVRGIPLARALDPATLLCWGMNDDLLRLAHGAPLRLVVPGWAANHWVKWLAEIVVQADPVAGFYQEKGYRIPSGPVEPGAAVPPDQMVPVEAFPVKSIIARPTDGSLVAAGAQEVVGVAFSGEAAIASVEVTIDGGKSWERAELEGEAAPGRWVVFRRRFEGGEPGAWTAMARATDAKGNYQSQTPGWNPSGYFWNGWHTVTWEVAPG